jgi:hypothetical protein
MLQCQPEPIAEFNDEDVVAELECPVGWNGRAMPSADIRGSERQ